ncbi:hypothetical protein EV182_001903, partial [Spiromyces aspiralis]
YAKDSYDRLLLRHEQETRQLRQKVSELEAQVEGRAVSKSSRSATASTPVQHGSRSVSLPNSYRQASSRVLAASTISTCLLLDPSACGAEKDDQVANGDTQLLGSSPILSQLDPPYADEFVPSPDDIHPVGASPPSRLPWAQLSDMQSDATAQQQQQQQPRSLLSQETELSNDEDWDSVDVPPPCKGQAKRQRILANDDDPGDENYDYYSSQGIPSPPRDATIKGLVGPSLEKRTIKQSPATARQRPSQSSPQKREGPGELKRCGATTGSVDVYIPPPDTPPGFWDLDFR